jgi:uncharacterized protein (TIGR02271 family)
MTEMTDAYTWRDRDVIDSQGEKVGSIKEIYEDERTGKPEWALATSGLFGMRSHFVPLAGAVPDGEQVRVSVTKDQVKDAPSVEGDGELSEREERTLFEHYGVPYTQEGSTTAQEIPDEPIKLAQTNAESETNWRASQRGNRHDVSGPNTDEAMTRSEEELRVGTVRRESGRVRLRKYVVTEQVTTTVPVQREEVRVEREPITEENRDQAMSGAAISEEEHEVVLHEEEPVVEKRTVPKERVQLSTETHQDEREISEEIRKEQIETDGIERTSEGRDRSTSGR